jgi:hypothetical protein
MKIPRALAVQRERDVWDLRMRGYSYDEISKKLDINPATIATILKRLTKRYRDQHLKEIEIIKDEQIAQHEMIYKESIEAWERSKKASITTRKKALGHSGSGISGNVEQTHESKDQFGDPRFLNEAMKAKEHIRKIVGADAPPKVPVDTTNKSDDELINEAKEIIASTTTTTDSDNCREEKTEC